MRSHRYVCPRITHHMLSTRTPFRQVIAPGGTVQSIILLALRATEKQVRTWIKNPVKIEIKAVKQLPGILTYIKFHNSEIGNRSIKSIEIYAKNQVPAAVIYLHYK